MKKLLKAFTLTAAAASLIVSCASTKTAGTISGDGEVFAVAINNPVPDGQIELLDSFEDGNFWQATSGELYSLDTEVVSEWYSEGSSSAKWTFKAVPKENTASIYCDALSDRNWEGAKALILDINNTTSKSFEVYLMINSGKRPVMTAVTAPVAIGVGTNTNVYFDLQNQLTDENGNPVPEIQEMKNVRKLSLVIKGKTKSGCLYTDNIRLVR